MDMVIRKAVVITRHNVIEMIDVTQKLYHTAQHNTMQRNATQRSAIHLVSTPQTYLKWRVHSDNSLHVNAAPCY